MMRRFVSLGLGPSSGDSAKRDISPPLRAHRAVEWLASC